MTYCESCPIFKTCDEPNEYKKTFKWCYQRERILKKSEYALKTEEIHSNLKKVGE